jgi:hypothetical protein
MEVAVDDAKKKQTSATFGRTHRDCTAPRMGAPSQWKWIRAGNTCSPQNYSYLRLLLPDLSPDSSFNNGWAPVRAVTDWVAFRLRTRTRRRVPHLPLRAAPSKVGTAGTSSTTRCSRVFTHFEFDPDAPFDLCRRRFKTPFSRHRLVKNPSPSAPSEKGRTVLAGKCALEGIIHNWNGDTVFRIRCKVRNCLNSKQQTVPECNGTLRLEARTRVAA